MKSPNAYNMAFAAVASLALGACSSVSDATKAEVARSETIVAQAMQSIGTSEHGAMELQQAKDHLGAAKTAVDKGDDKGASRNAEKARLDADLALAKAQSATAQRAADELTASIKSLRDESQRSSVPVR
jgi:hypothetical protein